MASVHHYRAEVSWAGSTGVGYDHYSRAHSLCCPPAGQELLLSGDRAFGGDPERLNPEQLLLAAASSCQLLSFLAVCARARIDVASYSDSASAEMPEDDRPVRITRILLRPRIVIAGEAHEERLPRLIDLAHRECYVANSLGSEITIEAEISIQP